ncbi:uncharacterized protein LOC115408259 [Salarias fasciatus]|uniref:uncharacterized protein LOC115408259 n=1 Tax=Salarias fasciatus TaxID=181472 RepID=UPI001176ADE9|nr:uncharacterized protein LOC115408259 [Salarias fasciatus]XP_029974767.1 uncharacterized protein LOC115408259 [Salarias fasciatus]
MHPASGSGGSIPPDAEEYCNVGRGRGWFFRDDVQTPKVGGLRSPDFCSTRLQVPPCELNAHQPSPQDELSTLISELANQIGQSIVNQLKGDMNVCESAPAATFIEEQKSEQKPELNLSGFKLVMHSDVKEPPVFKGDSSDTCSVREWVEMVELYLLKRDIPTNQQSQEILARLRGKAKDVVKVTLRHNHSIDHIQTPELIFDILKQHFSDLTYSSMPMADFYNTKPQQNEGVMEYWIRLNNAIDIADECLRRQGRSIEDPGREVAMMFIKYCPDPILYNRLSFKAAEEWTTSEVQDRIDSFQRELRSRTQASQRRGICHTQTAAVPGLEQSEPKHVSSMLQLPPAPCTSQQPAFTTFGTVPAPMTPSVITSQLSPTAAQFIPGTPTVLAPSPPQMPTSLQHVSTSESAPVAPSRPATGPICEPVRGQLAPVPNQNFDVNGMHTLISLLDRIMAHQNIQVTAPAPLPSRRPASGPLRGRNCRVCGDTSHSTLMHCRRENLCLSCFAPGHWKKDCTKQGQTPRGETAGSRSQHSEN